MKRFIYPIATVALVTFVYYALSITLDDRQELSPAGRSASPSDVSQATEPEAIELDRIERRFKEFDPQFDHGPNHPFSYYNLARFNCTRERPDRAIFFLNEAIKSAPKFTEAYHFRGLLHFAQGRLKTAIPDLDQVLELAPDTFIADHYRQRVSDCLDKGLRCPKRVHIACQWSYLFGRGRVISGPPKYLHNRGPFLPKLD